MSIASLDYDKIDKSKKRKLGEFVAKRALMQAFKHLQGGRLTIEDGDETLVFGDLKAEQSISAVIHIKDKAAYSDMMLGGSIGAGESYMLGRWASPNLVNLVRLLSCNIHLLNQFDQSRPFLQRIFDKCFHFFNNNSLTGSKKNISAHYDLGNDFFSLFLDPTMMYSSAIYRRGDESLEEASQCKLDTICQKLQLSPEDHLLEIGTGWGGLAVHAAKHYGCRVTTTTISKEQYNFARARVREEGLEAKVRLLLEDYRDLTVADKESDKYDKLVSIEMIEAVGHAYYRDYFASCSKLLKQDGLMLIHAITIPDQRFEAAKSSVDFIQRYIFPGGCLPSNAVMAQCVAEHTDMQIYHLEDIGLSYAQTLADWRERFFASMEEVKAQGFDDVFCRMWDFYLCYCEGGFRERAISTVQLLMAKPRAKTSQLSAPA